MAQDEFWDAGRAYLQHPNVKDEKRPPSSSTGGGSGARLDLSNVPLTQPSAPTVSFVFI
jgi:hypothetical protein